MGERLVTSFHEPAVAAVRAIVPDVSAGIPVGAWIENTLTVAERYSCEAIHPHLKIEGAPFGGESPASTDSPRKEIDILSEAHDLSCAVNVWTVWTGHEPDRLSAAGVDGVIADCPNLLRWT